MLAQAAIVLLHLDQPGQAARCLGQARALGRVGDDQHVAWLAPWLGEDDLAAATLEAELGTFRDRVQVALI